MVRERRERGFDLGASKLVCCGKRRGPRAAMDGGLRARGELCSGNERDRRSLGEVEEGVKVLTAGGIELGWLDGGD